MIVRTTYAKLADPSRRGALAAEIRSALDEVGLLWLHVGLPADEASEVWDVAVLAGCPDEATVAAVHLRIVAALDERAAVLKAWSFSVAP